MQSKAMPRHIEKISNAEFQSEFSTRFDSPGQNTAENSNYNFLLKCLCYKLLLNSSHLSTVSITETPLYLNTPILPQQIIKPH